MTGRAPTGQALVASDGAASVSTLTGFDPSRLAGIDMSVTESDLIRRGDVLRVLRELMLDSARLPVSREIVQTYIGSALRGVWRASAIEARSDATGTGAAEGESAVGEAETPKGGSPCL